MFIKNQGIGNKPMSYPKTDIICVTILKTIKAKAQTIADLYRYRWQIELFFKWIKQHLRIKSFYGTSENAVKTQIWIAVSVYVLVAIIKKRLKIETSIYNILQVLSLTLFEKISLIQLLDKSDNYPVIIEDAIQLNLFDNFLGH